ASSLSETFSCYRDVGGWLSRIICFRMWGMDHTDLDQQLAGLAGLGDPLRRALYRYVAERGVPVSRDDAAATVGISRPLAAYHLDRLVDDGLLEPRYRRRGD